MAVERGQYASPTPYLEGNFDPEALRRVIDRLPANVFGEREARGPVQTLTRSSSPLDVENVKEGGLVDRNGEICVRRGSQLEPLAISISVAARIRGMLQVRDALREVFETQLSATAEESDVVNARRDLNRYTTRSFLDSDR